MYFYCEKCKNQYPLNTHAIRCSCGGLFRLHKDPEDVVPQDVSIGHMVTPLVPMNVGGIEVLLKLENDLRRGRGACCAAVARHHEDRA